MKPKPLAFRCSECGAIYLSTDGTGLCHCASIGEPHPPKWYQLVNVVTGETKWLCEECRRVERELEAMFIVIDLSSFDD